MLEVERLKQLLKQLSKLSRDSVGQLKRQLDSLKRDSNANQEELSAEFQRVNSAWQRIQDESSVQTRQLIKQTMDHELEINDVRQNLETMCNKVQVLKCDKEMVEQEKVKTREEHERERQRWQAKIEEMSSQMAALQARLDEMVAEKEKVIKEVTDKLNRDYNCKVDSLKSRFRLMTSIERSPSDTSLEKIERHDLLEMSGAESLLSQSHHSRGGMAIKGMGTDRRSDLYSTSPSTLLGSCSPKSPSSSTKDFFRRVLEEKENQMDTLRSNLDQLIRDNDKYKQTIIQLTDSRVKDDDMAQKLYAVQQELEEEKRKRAQMETSVSVFSKM